MQLLLHKKTLFKDNFLHIFMVSYNCLCCHYITPNKYNYTKHLHTKKHLLIFNQKKQQNEGKNEEKLHLLQQNRTYKSFWESKMFLKIFVSTAVRFFPEMII